PARARARGRLPLPVLTVRASDPRRLARRARVSEIGALLDLGGAREQHAAALDALDDRARRLGRERRAAEAAPHPAAAAGAEVRAHVVGGVDHDAARAREVVDAGVEAVELEREPVLAGVGRAGEEGAETRAVAL